MQDLQYLLPLSKDWRVYLDTCWPQCLLQFYVSYTLEIDIFISLSVGSEVSVDSEVSVQFLIVKSENSTILF